jgi:CheY-like chemotaxis protein
LREVGQGDIDIVLLDLNPRNEDGWDTLQCLAALRPNLPIVAMTARQEYLEPNSSAHRVDVLLEKPLNLSVLIHTLQQLASPTPNTRRSGQSESNDSLRKNNTQL